MDKCQRRPGRKNTELDNREQTFVIQRARKVVVPWQKAVLISVGCPPKPLSPLPIVPQVPPRQSDVALHEAGGRT